MRYPEFAAPDIGWLAMLPLAVVAITAMVVLLQGVLGKRGDGDSAPRPWPAYTSLVGLGVAAALTLLALLGGQGTSFGDMLLFDRATAVFWWIVLAVAALAVLLARDFLTGEHVERSEVFALILLSTVGMMVMAASGHLVMIFLGLETMSVALYILAGLAGTRDRGSSEAALKYLLLGAFATGFLIYGMAFIYGATGTLSIGGVASVVAGGEAQRGFLNLGLGLLAIGLGFKVAAVPFHMWAPDVYEGAPTAISAFMSAGPKVAAFAALVRVFIGAAAPHHDAWVPVLWLLALLTMLVGNVMALVQTSVKRLLAYSSIAHAGYLLVGVAAGSEQGAQAIIYYAMVYSLLSIGAFAVVLAISREGIERPTLDDFTGLGRRAPWTAAAMTLFLGSMAGIPPLAGFLGKYLLFASAVQSGLVGLAALGVLFSIISVYYYAKLIVLMYMSDDDGGAEVVLGDKPRTAQVIAITAIGTIVLSFPIGVLFMQLGGWAAVGLG